PASHTPPRAYRWLARGCGEGSNGPWLVVAKLPRASRPASAGARSEAGQRGAGGAAGSGSAVGALERLRSSIAAQPGVASVGPARINLAGNVATISVYPRSSPQAYATTQLVQHLRGLVAPLMADAGATAYIGGVTAR